MEAIKKGDRIRVLRDLDYALRTTQEAHDAFPTREFHSIKDTTNKHRPRKGDIYEAIDNTTKYATVARYTDWNGFPWSLKEGDFEKCEPPPTTPVTPEPGPKKQGQRGMDKIKNGDYVRVLRDLNYGIQPTRRAKKHYERTCECLHPRKGDVYRVSEVLPDGEIAYKAWEGYTWFLRHEDYERAEKPPSTLALLTRTLLGSIPLRVAALLSMAIAINVPPAHQRVLRSIAVNFFSDPVVHQSAVYLFAAACTLAGLASTWQAAKGLGRGLARLGAHRRAVAAEKEERRTRRAARDEEKEMRYRAFLSTHGITPPKSNTAAITQNAWVKFIETPSEGLGMKIKYSDSQSRAVRAGDCVEVVGIQGNTIQYRSGGTIYNCDISRVVPV